LKKNNKILQNTNWKSGSWAVFLVIGIAILARVVFFLADLNNPIHLFPVVDETHYISEANKLINNNFIPTQTFWHPPLYSYFIAFLIFLGFGLKSIVFFQMILGVGGVYFLYLALRRINQKAALVASLIWAIYPLQLFLETRILSENLYHFLIIYLVYVLINKSLHKNSILIGLLFSLLVLTKVQILLFLPVFFLLFYKNISWKWTIKFLPVFLIPLILVSISNYKNSDKEVWFISYNGPMNLYLGNSTDIKQTLNLRPSDFHPHFYPIMYDDNTQINDASAIFAVEKQDVLIKKVLEENTLPILLKNLTLKTLNTLLAKETPRNYDLYLLREENPYLKIFIGKYPYYPLALFYFAAILFFVYKRKEIWKDTNKKLLFWLILILILPCIFFFNSFRYRLVAVPFLLFFSVLFYMNYYKKLLPMFLNSLLIILLGTPIFKTIDFQKIPKHETYELFGNALRSKQQHEKANEYFDLAEEERIKFKK
jgi:hypothetical protein